MPHKQTRTSTSPSVFCQIRLSLLHDGRRTIRTCTIVHFVVNRPTHGVGVAEHLPNFIASPPPSPLTARAPNCGRPVLGGGGGFLQAEVTVSPGEVLEVLVGGGGGPSRGEAGGAGGFNGGQAGNSRCHAVGCAWMRSRALRVLR